MNALQRVRSAPGLWLGLWVTQLVIAYAFSRPVAATVSQAISPHTYLREQLLPGIGELFSQNPELGALIGTAVVTAGILSAITWILLVAGVISRLSGPKPTAEFIGTAASKSPHMLIVTFYALIARALALMTAGLLVRGLEQPLIKAAAVFVVWSICSVALDRARTQIVLAEASALHPKTLLHSFRDLFRTVPKQLAAAVGVNFLAAGFIVCSLFVAVWGMGTGWAIWAGRGLAGLTLAATLWRIAIAVESVEQGRSQAG